MNNNGTVLACVQALVVENYSDSANLLKMALDLCGATVITAASVQSALEVLDRNSIDVVITEIALPHKSGLSLVTQLRNREMNTGTYIPAIATTGYFSHLDRGTLVQELLSAGFQEFFPKPINLDDLVESVRLLAPCRKSLAIATSGSAP